MLKKMLKTITDQRTLDRRTELQNNLMRHEARVGGTLFGDIPKGHRREFFCLDEYTWVWYEEWKDASGKQRTTTTRYDVRPAGVIKIQDGHPSNYVSREEGRNLYHAIHLYNQKLDAEFAQFL